MKFLKVKLADGKQYTFTTLTLAEQRKLKGKYEEFQEKQELADRLRFNLDENGESKKNANGEVFVKILSKEEKEQLTKLEEEGFVFMLDTLRLSLAKNHKEFSDVGSTENVANLVDTDDLRRITMFIFQGTYVKEDATIDVTVEGEDPTKK